MDQMLAMVYCLAEDEDVIEVAKAYLPPHISQYSLHQPLKYCMGIAQSNNYDCKPPRASCSIKLSLVTDFACEFTLTIA